MKQNQFGGSIGGPILRDRTFFFVAYQGLLEANGFGNKSVAILPLLTQDRSAPALGSQFCPELHLNSQGQPATGYLTVAGGTQVACDGSNINPVALAVLNAKLPDGEFAVPIPQVGIPNSGPDPSDQLPEGQSTFNIPAHFREDQFTVNLDHNLGGTNTLSGRFFYSRAPTNEPFSIVIAVNHAHHVLKGCVYSAPDGLELQTSDKQTYLLEGNAADIKAGERVKLHGARKKAKGHRNSFSVEKVSKDYGPCSDNLALNATR